MPHTQDSGFALEYISPGASQRELEDSCLGMCPVTPPRRETGILSGEGAQTTPIQLTPVPVHSPGPVPVYLAQCQWPGVEPLGWG